MYDIIVIGAGVGGYTAAIKAAKAGYRTAIVENKQIGGTCLNRGCIPTKYLISEVHRYGLYKKKIADGIFSGEITVDYPTLTAKMQERINSLTSGILWLLKSNHVELYQGTAEFLDCKRVFIAETKETLKAEVIIIATGSQPRVMPFSGKKEKILGHIFTTDTIFSELKDIPNSLAVIGGGAVGLEMAFMYAGLGSKVTILEQKKSLFKDIDGDIDTEVLKMLHNKNIDVIFDARIDSIFLDEEGVSIIGKDEEEISHTSTVLFAIGRIPNVVGLNLDKAGVLTENGRIITDNYYRTTCENIYAIGDVNGQRTLAYSAMAQAENVISYIQKRNSVKNENVIPNCIFLDSEVAFVGMTEKQAKDENKDVRIAKFLMSANGRSNMDENKGFIKVIADKKTDVILGGVCISTSASEMISYFSMAVQMKMTVSQLAGVVFPHPTYSEAFSEVAELVNNNCIYML